jgi:VWFA-related protein
MNRTLGHLAALLTAAVAGVIAAPQTQLPQFGTSNRTVAVYATVTGANGRLVPDLGRDEFAVDDNGKRQPLTLFSNDVQPITLIMLLDRSGSMKQNFELEEHAAEAFVQAMLPADKARIGSFAKYIQIDPEDFTSDRDQLIKILRTELQADGPTPLWNAVDRGIDKLLIEQGRRVILVFTDGVDMPLNFASHNKSLKDVMKRAEEFDVMVYAIGLAGHEAGFGPPPGIGGIGGWGRGRGGGGGGYGGGSGRAGADRPDPGLAELAAQTGGGYFELTNTSDLKSTFARVVDELHHQYALGFTPEKLDGKMHKLDVRLKNPSFNVRARRSYLARKDVS